MTDASELLRSLANRDRQRFRKKWRGLDVAGKREFVRLMGTANRRNPVLDALRLCARVGFDALAMEGK